MKACLKFLKVVLTRGPLYWLAKKYNTTLAAIRSFWGRHHITKKTSCKKYTEGLVEAPDIDKEDFSIAEKFSIANIGLDMDRVYTVKDESVV